MPINVWNNSWNNIIRNILFKDKELKTLMCVPEDTNILDFIDRYFIRAGFTNELLKDEKVRIVYSDIEPSQTNSPHVAKSQMSFDIYVKIDSLHNATKDRLQYRTQLIAGRLSELLLNRQDMYGFKFWLAGDWDLGTRTVGYARYNVSFNYMKVY